MPTKRIVCLANSRKPKGRCVAGREVMSPGAWIRPVSDRPDQAVSRQERRCRDSIGRLAEPKLLDVVDVPLREHRPQDYQSENWLLDPGCRWTKRDVYPASDLHRLCDQDGDLWVNGHETYHGTNDRVPLQLATGLADSLRLIHVHGMSVRVLTQGEDFGNPRRRVQACFRFNHADYALIVTDPEIEAEFLSKSDGEYAHRPCYLTVSLSEPFQGYCYKLVAGMIKVGPGPSRPTHPPPDVDLPF